VNRGSILCAKSDDPVIGTVYWITINSGFAKDLSPAEVVLLNNFLRSFNDLWKVVTEKPSDRVLL
jgi:hypothetical protein